MRRRPWLPALPAALAILWLGASLWAAAPLPRARTAPTAAVAAVEPMDSGPSLGFPYALAADPSGALFLVDRGAAFEEGVPAPVDPTILRIDPDGTVSLVADAWLGSGPPLSGRDLFLEPDGQLLFGFLRIDPQTGDRIRLPPLTGVAGFFSKAPVVLPESESSLLLGGARGILRYDRGTGALTIVSGCPASGTCVPVGAGPPLGQIGGLALWGEGFVLAAASGILAVDLLTGDRTLVSGRGRGTGPNVDFGLRGAIALEPSGQILAVNGTAVLGIDPDTGDRTIVSDESTGSGPAFRRVEAMVLEPAGTLALADADLGAVVRMDLATGDRTLVAGGPIGTGPRPSCAAAADWEASARIFLADCDAGILRVDLLTGDRSVVSDAATGEGPLLGSVRDIVVEPSGMLLVVDGGTLKRVHPSTGDRTTISNRLRGRFLDARALALESPTSALVGDDGVEVPIPSGGLLLRVHLYSALLRVDLTTGRSEVVSGGGLLSRKRGKGPGFFVRIPFLTLTPPDGAATAGLFDGLFRGVSLSLVDLAGGDRTLASGPGRGVGPRIDAPQDVALDESGALWVVDFLQHALYRVDLETGDRILVSGRERGRGPPLDRPRAVLVDPEGRVIVANAGSSQPSGEYPFAVVIRVDPATGDRTVLSRY